MTIDALIAGSGCARLDAEVLAAHAVRRDRTWLLAHAGEDPGTEASRHMAAFFDRRRNGEPVAYITGEKEFYGRPFFVSPSVLIPRPSTEGLVESALAFLDDGKETMMEVDRGIAVLCRSFGPVRDATAIVDIGTGSGCIAITIALERPDFIVIAVDISREALAVAERNASRHGMEDHLIFLESDALQRLSDFSEPFVVVSNPPYVPSGETLPNDVSAFEPHGALFAGKDGMDVIRPLWREAQRLPHCRGIVLECTTGQAKELLKGNED